jgi:hypothetical protein
MLNPNCTTHRDAMQALSPSWLQGPVGVRLMYTMAIALDALADWYVYASAANCPSQAPPDAVPWISQDRGLSTGPQQSSASVMRQQQLWLDLWKRAGNPTGLLLAIRSYFYGIASGSPAVSLILDGDPVGTAAPNGGSTWYQYAAGAPDFLAGAQDPVPPSVERRGLGRWNWDGTNQYFRSWLVIYADNVTLAAPTKTWGAPNPWNYDDGTIWGISGTLANAALAPSLQARARQWKAANAVIPNIIICFDNTWLQPDSPTAKLPNGTWNNPASITRLASPCAFLDGVA